MRSHIRELHDICIGRYTLLLLFMSAVIICMTGVGSRQIVALAGCVLCTWALTKGPVRVDLWIFIPMMVYVVINGISTVRASGDVFNGFFTNQIIFPVIYLMAAYLTDRERILMRRLCAVWAAVLSLCGITYFICTAFTAAVVRLDIMFDNPNTLGCFLVISWFALRESDPEEDGPLKPVTERIEPFILSGLALTLSLGSLLVAVSAGIVLMVQKCRGHSRREKADILFSTAAKAVAGLSPGILIYFTAVMNTCDMLCILILIYLLMLSVYWPMLGRFLNDFKLVSPIITAAGVIMAYAALSLRPNALTTFGERLLMMKSGLSYLFKEPLLGIGPYRWRGMDMTDGDIYFNTWYIHDSLLHVGVELGLIALAACLVIVIRRYMKGGSGTAGFSAFLFHNLIDVSFFYSGVTCMTILTTSSPGECSHVMSRTVKDFIFAAYMLVFLYTGFKGSF